MSGQRRPRLRREPSYRGEDFGPDWRGWTVVQWTVSGKLRLGDRAIWVDRAPLWRPARGRWVWRMTATAPDRGGVEWRWDPGRDDYVCGVSGFPPTATPGAVSALWKDAQRLLGMAKKGGRPRGSGRVKDLPSQLADFIAQRSLPDLPPHHRRNVVQRTPVQQQVADFLGVRVRRLQELWREQKNRQPGFPSWDDWLEDNDLKAD